MECEVSSVKSEACGECEEWTVECDVGSMKCGL